MGRNSETETTSRNKGGKPRNHYKKGTLRSSEKREKKKGKKRTAGSFPGAVKRKKEQNNFLGRQWGKKSNPLKNGVQQKRKLWGKTRTKMEGESRLMGGNELNLEEHEDAGTRRVSETLETG